MVLVKHAQVKPATKLSATAADILRGGGGRKRAWITLRMGIPFKPRRGLYVLCTHAVLAQDAQHTLTPHEAQHLLGSNSPALWVCREG